MAQSTAKALSHSESYKALFRSVFPSLVQELTEDGLNNPEILDGVKHLREVLNFNVPHGVLVCRQYVIALTLNLVYVTTLYSRLHYTCLV